MNLDDNTKWIIEKAVVIVTALIGVIGSGKLLSARPAPQQSENPDTQVVITEQRQLLKDLNSRIDELEDAVTRKDRFILHLLQDLQAHQRTINDLERALNRPPTQWELNVVNGKEAV